MDFLALSLHYVPKTTKDILNEAGNSWESHDCGWGAQFWTFWFSLTLLKDEEIR